MDADGKIEQYCILANGARGLALQDLIQRATAEPGIFAFGELLSVPAVQELSGPAKDLLELFSYGTLSEYRVDPNRFPALSEAQHLKLKQLTVASIAAHTKTIPYDDLLQQLEISSLRELEDLIITHCFYPQLIKGKLDQKQHCLQVEEVYGRDVRAGDVQGIIAGLQLWLSRARSMLSTIEDKIVVVAEAADAAATKQASRTAQLETVKQQLKNELESRGNQDAMMLDEPGHMLDLMDEDRTGTAMHGRPKRRR